MRPILLVLSLLAAPALATVPTGFTESAYTSAQLGQATKMAWAPDGSGRLFILLKGGAVRVAQLQDGQLVQDGGQLVTTLFATESVVTSSESGLIGIAFDPNYALNRYVYLFVTVSNTEQRIVRYIDSGGVGTQRAVIVSALPSRGETNNGGGIGFGPDGHLYWSIGDNGAHTGVDADLVSLAAKVGRATVLGRPVSSNPFFDGVGPNNEFIWARGLRNPYSLTFRPSNGELWVNSSGSQYEQVFVLGRGDHAGWKDYENNQPAGYVPPAIKYRTNGVDGRNLTALVRAGGVTTFTTVAAHGLRKGERLTVSGVTDASFNGVVYVASTPSPTTWTAVQAGADATSSGGVAETANLGGAVTGGAFYDASLFPPEYRGNFFFTDFNAAALTRASFAEDGTVATVDPFGTQFAVAVDVQVGPDGAVYVLSFSSGKVSRVTPTAPAQRLVVSPLNLRVPERGHAVVHVSLAQAPEEDVHVTTSVQDGEAGLSIVEGATLTFTPTNWNQPQAVTVTAADDANSDMETATLQVAAAGLSSETVTARSIDNNGPKLVLSHAALSVEEGGENTFTVALDKAPGETIGVTVARTAGDTDLTVAAGTLLNFTNSNWSQPQTVTLSAAQDADNEDDTAVITVVAPGAHARQLPVTLLDTDPRAPTITSTPVTAAFVGAPYLYQVAANGRPAATFSVVSAEEGLVIDPATGALSWTPEAPGNVEVTVIASNGVPPDAEQTFTLEVAPDQPPTVTLVRPANGDHVSGATAELYGDCSDDVGCVRAEFYVDGALLSEEDAASTRYHAFGEPNRWDTTALAPGNHTVSLTVYDTRGQTASASAQVCVGDCDGADPEDPPGGCACGAGPQTPVLLAAALLLAARRRRPH